MGFEIFFLAFVTVIVVVAVIVRSLWSQIFGNKSPRRPSLGMEQVDMAKFRAGIRAPIMSGIFGRGLESNRQYEHAVAQTHAMAARLNPDVTHGTYNNADSAQRLVKGIALQNKVALFLSGSEADATENEVIVLDLLSALGLSPRIVNVASDADMHLGLPQRDSAADLPHLYLGGMAFGGIQTILDAARDGSLTTGLTRVGIPFDADAAEQLRRS